MTTDSITRREILMLASSLLLTSGRASARASNSAPRDMKNPYEEEWQQATSKDGTVIGYLKQGTGSPLLFVHGTTADHRSWIALSPYFDSRLSICLMDRRGRGASGDSPEYALMREAEDVAAVVEAIGEPVFVFGHSFGGLCSLEAALLTDKISRLILYEPPIPTGVPTIPPGVPERIQTLIDRGELEAAMELCLREVAEIPEHELAAYRQSPLWNARIPLAATIPRELSIEQTYRFDAARFAGLHVPIMLLQGGDSPAVYRRATDILHTALPAASVVVLPGQQHIAHHTNPELLAREILQFLQA